MKAYYAPGRYWGKITRQSLGVSKEKKTPQFCISFVIMGQVNVADPQGDLIVCPQYERTVFRYVTDKTVDFLLEDLQTLGVELPGASFRYLDPDQDGFVDLAGKECEFFCSHETYEGEQKEKWGLSRGGGSLNVEKLDDKGIKNLDALFGKKLKELAPVKAPQRQTAPQGPPVGRTEHETKVLAEAEASWERDDRNQASVAEQDIPF